MALGVGALVLVGGYAAAVVSVSGDVPAGTSVRGVDIGGMTTEQAAATLEEELGDEASAPIPVTAGEATTELDPEESGLAVDWEATASQSTGIILSPITLMDHLRGEVELEPITTTDADALAASLESLAEVAAVEPVEPTIRYSKSAEATYTAGVPGTLLDVPAAADLVSDGVLPARRRHPRPADDARRAAGHGRGGRAGLRGAGPTRRGAAGHARRRRGEAPRSHRRTSPGR